MTRITVEGIRNWIQQHRTTAEYAFGSENIAIGLNADPIGTFAVCCMAVNAGMLAYVEDPRGVYGFTLRTVGEMPPKTLRSLLDAKRIVKAGDHYEWISRAVTP